MPKNYKLSICRLKTQKSNQITDDKIKEQYQDKESIQVKNRAARGDSNEPESPRPYATLPPAVEKSIVKPIINSIETKKKEVKPCTTNIVTAIPFNTQTKVTVAQQK